MLISTLFNGFTGLIIAYFQYDQYSSPDNDHVLRTGRPLYSSHSYCSGNLGLTGIVWSMTITEAITCLIGIGLFIFSKKK